MELVGFWAPPGLGRVGVARALAVGEAWFDVRVATMVDGSTERRTLADKLNHLFETVHPRGRAPYSNNEVAAAMGVSGTYIGQLRKGLRDNPTKRHIEGIAAFFGVDPAYFFDDEVTDRIDQRLALLVRLRDAGATNVAARLVGLSPGMLEVADSFLSHLREVEGLRDGTSEEETGGPPPAGPDAAGEGEAEADR
jgi:transcriptional regulator with XRE-family HTH domain